MNELYMTNKSTFPSKLVLFLKKTRTGGLGAFRELNLKGKL